MNGPGIIIFPDGTRVNMATVVSYSLSTTAIQFTTVASTSSFYSYDSTYLLLSTFYLQMIDGFYLGRASNLNDVQLLALLPLVPPVMMYSLSAYTGSHTGGDNITVTGQGFQNGCVVYMNGTACATVFSSATSISFTTAAGAAGLASIQVVNPDNSQNTALNAWTWT